MLMLDAATDADQLFGVQAHAFNEILADILVEDDHLNSYPFFVHGVEGGIPIPEKPHLVGSIRPPPRVLTGSVKKQVRLTGSVNKRRVLKGSVRTTNYGKKR
jgi:hypothetical protein